MRYRGDGNYNVNGRTPELSFIEILNEEYEAISKLNEAYSAFDVAAKNNLRTVQYQERIDKYEQRVKDARQKIKLYCSQKLGIKTDIPEQLYKPENTYTRQPVNLTRMRRKRSNGENQNRPL